MPKYQSRTTLTTNGIVEIAKPKASTQSVDLNFLDAAFSAYKKHKVQRNANARGRPLSDMRNLKSSLENLKDSKPTSVSPNNSPPPNNKENDSMDISGSESDSETNSSGVRRLSRSGTPQQLRFVDVVEVVEVEKHN